MSTALDAVADKMLASTPDIGQAGNTGWGTILSGGRPRYRREFQTSLDQMIAGGFILATGWQEVVELAQLTWPQICHPLCRRDGQNEHKRIAAKNAHNGEAKE